MLFFDDCNWGDHCAAVANGCRDEMTGLGPVVVRTPRRLRWPSGRRASSSIGESRENSRRRSRPSNSTSKRPTYLSRTRALSPMRARGIWC